MQKTLEINKNDSNSNLDTLRKEFTKIKTKVKKSGTKIPYTSQLTGKTVAEKNEQFSKLNDCDKAKEIALDSLHILMTKANVYAHKGGYWSNDLSNLLDYTMKKFDGIVVKEKLQELFTDENLPSCEVCQRGLWMLSQLRVAAFELPEGFKQGKIPSGVKSTVNGITVYNLEKMEIMYEGWRIDHDKNNEGLTPSENSKYKPQTNQMLANIVCNIIQNCRFKINDHTDYLKLWKIKLKND